MDSTDSEAERTSDPVEHLRRASPEAAKIIRELLAIEKKHLGYERVPRTVKDDVIKLIKTVVHSAGAEGPSDEA